MNISQLLQNLETKLENAKPAKGLKVNTHQFENVFGKELDKKSSGDTAYRSKKTEKATQQGKATPKPKPKAKGKAAQPASADSASKQDQVSNVQDTKPAEQTAPVTQQDQPSKEVIQAQQTVTPAAEPSAEATSPVDDTILLQLSAILEMPEEKLAGMLDALGLTPADLLEKDNLNKLLQAVYQVQSPVELLNVPNIKDVMASIQQMLQDIAQNGVPETMVQDTTQQTQQTAPMQETAPTAKAEVTVSQPVHTQTVAEKEGATNTTEPLVLGEEGLKVEGNADASGTGNTGGEGKAQQHGHQAEQKPLPNAMEPVATETTTPKDVQLNAQVMAETPVAQLSKATAKAQAMSTLNTQDVVNQLVERMKVEIKGNVSEMRITLKPEHLGDVSMKVATENGIVTAHFVAESQRVKEVIESNFNQLKDTLSQQGLQVAQLSVSVGENRQDERMRQFIAGQQKSAHRISQLINGISQEIEGEPIGVDTKAVYNNSVEYQA